jgi:anti-sigma regulatory factor (Ser/Thr protein kinase)
LGNKLDVAGRIWRLLPARPEAVPLARQLIGELSVDTETTGVLALLTSEVVSNAVRHGPSGDDDQISLDASIVNGHVLVEVCDEGSPAEPAVVHHDDPLQPGGLGLRLVDRLSIEWGSRRDEVRCVWFKVAPA